MRIPASHTKPADNDGNGGYACSKCGHEHTRVTQILDQVVPKFALVPWAYKCGKEGIDIEQEKLKGGERGTELHGYLSEYITSGIMPPVDVLKEEHRPYGRQLHRFLDDYDPEFLATEIPIAEHSLDYAGTLDGFAIIRKQPPRRNKPVDLTGQRVLFDLKTSRDGRVYTPTHQLQMAMYEWAWQEMGGEPSNYQIIVAVGEKSYQVAVSHFQPPGLAAAHTVNYYNMLQEMKQKKGKR